MKPKNITSRAPVHQPVKPYTWLVVSLYGVPASKGNIYIYVCIHT